MPRGDFNIYFASSRRGEHVRAEEYVAVGIVLLVVIIAALLILGCWYFKKRSGYKIIRLFLFTFPQIPNAPPAYEKVSSVPLPPPYTP
uniref:Melan-A n=1 Tax=Labrus bergylta TaxID=56723 RepID=A0A3Q3FZE6_9LABR